MSEVYQPSYLGDFPIAADAPAVARLGFIRKTYTHLAGAVGAFVLLEAILFRLGVAEEFALSMTGGWQWLLVLGAFMVVSWIANRWARSDTSVGLQYIGLGIYVVAEGLIFLPLLYIAAHFAGKDVIPTAGLLTLLIFCGLTAVVFTTKKDFSFLLPALWIAGLAVFGLVIAGLVFGFSLGIFFTVAMIAVAGGWILYDTSQVLHHYRVGQHVAASLALFSSLALLFWYILQLLMSLSSRD